MSAVEWTGALRGGGPKAATGNHLPGTCLRLAARGLAGGAWWTPGEATVGAVLTRAGIPSPGSEQAGDLASQVDGWALRGKLPSPEAGVLRLRVQGEHGPVFTMDRRRGPAGWEYRLWTGSAPSEGPIRPPAPEAMPLHAGPPRRPAPAPAAPPERAPVAHPGRTAASWIRPERVVSRMEFQSPEGPLLSNAEGEEEEAPTSPPPPPPPPPPAVKEAPVALHTDAPQRHRGAEVLFPEPAPVAAPAPAPDTEQAPEAVSAPVRKAPAAPRRPARAKAPAAKAAPPAPSSPPAPTRVGPAPAELAPPLRREVAEGPDLRCRAPARCRRRVAPGLHLCPLHAREQSDSGAPRPTVCQAEGCEAPVLTRGLCRRCYQRTWRRNRDRELAGLLPEQPQPVGGARRPPAQRDQAARQIWHRLKIFPAAGPWEAAGDEAWVRRRLLTGEVVARIKPDGGKVGRWLTWGCELHTPDGAAVPLDHPPRGLEQARSVADAHLRAAGWGLA